MPNPTIDRDLHALLRTVKESPFDDLPRLVLADWLTDRDDPRGELIRVQCELWRKPIGHRDRDRLAAREAALLNEYGPHWTGGDHEGIAVRCWRGLLHLSVETAFLASHSLPKAVRAALEQGWVETLRLVGGNASAAGRKFLAVARHVAELDLTQSFLSSVQFERFTTRRELQRLAVLNLGYSGMEFRSALEVAGGNRLPNLQYVLRDCNCRLGYLHALFRRHPGLRVLNWSGLDDDSLDPRERIFPTQPEQFPELINWSDSPFSPPRLYLLTQDPGAINLRALLLNECNIFDEDLGGLAGSPHLRNLEILDLGHNNLTDHAVVALAEIGDFPNLVYLQLEYNRIGDRGLTALAAAPWTRNLRLLDLGPNRVGSDGLIALAKSPYLKNLELLSLWGNEVGDEGVVALAESENFARLRELYVGNNRITDVGAKAVAESPHLGELRIVRFENNTGVNYNAISGEVRKKLKERFGDGAEVGGSIG